jgi:hypothetical protein|tara:strand:+ start:256 stop:441 length:186 start_codon:yes stop_codon:yes gene_type:complete
MLPEEQQEITNKKRNSLYATKIKENISAFTGYPLGTGVCHSVTDFYAAVYVFDDLNGTEYA